MKPFSILGFSVNDEVLCHACLVATTAVTGEILHHTCSKRRRKDEDTLCLACTASDNARADHSDPRRPILPLYFADATVRDELCTQCQRPLLDLVLQAEADRAKALPAFIVQKTRHQGRYQALQFDRRPPTDVRTDLKKAGWRWDPAQQHWWHKGPQITVPASVGLPPPPPTIAARPPIIRKLAAVIASA